MAVEIQLVSMLALNASKELAMEFIVNEYGLDKAADDRDRAYRFSLFAGKQCAYNVSFLSYLCSIEYTSVILLTRMMDDSR